MVAIKRTTEDLRASFSRIKLWRRCKKAHDYHYNQQLRKRKPPVALVRGSYVHDLLEVWKDRDRLKIRKDYERKYGRIFDEEREIYGDLIGDGWELVRRYSLHWKNDQLKYVPIRGVRSEIKLEFPLGKGVTFVGKIDKYPEDPKGRRWVMDHKTNKKIPDEESRFNDYQLLLYIWILQKFGEKPTGVVWDYIRTKPPAEPKILKSGELSQAQGIDTTHEIYLKAVKDNKLDPKDYQETLDNLKGREEEFFRRIFLPYSNSMLEQIITETRAAALQIQQFGHEWKDRTMTKECKQCQYYLLCHAELRGLDADFIRKKEYEIKGEEDASEQVESN